MGTRRSTKGDFLQSYRGRSRHRHLRRPLSWPQQRRPRNRPNPHRHLRGEARLRDPLRLPRLLHLQVEEPHPRVYRPDPQAGRQRTRLVTWRPRPRPDHGLAHGAGCKPGLRDWGGRDAQGRQRHLPRGRPAADPDGGVRGAQDHRQRHRLHRQVLRLRHRSRGGGQGHHLRPHRVLGLRGWRGRSEAHGPRVRLRGHARHPRLQRRRRLPAARGRVRPGAADALRSAVPRPPRAVPHRRRRGCRAGALCGGGSRDGRVGQPEAAGYRTLPQGPRQGLVPRQGADGAGAVHGPLLPDSLRAGFLHRQHLLFGPGQQRGPRRHGRLHGLLLRPDK
mmetsp:Transcript_7410/g.15974  ORF Transcript_7410/g.15974 Transcript_7410/m.15974 type:complete len:334 (+) Transcript_7410:497-1498(+)